MTEWKEYKLGEIINLKRGYDLPKSKRESGFYPIVSSSGITDFHKEYMKLPPGVVTGRYGTIGKVFFIKEPYWPLNTTLYITDFKGNEPKFIFYYLQSFDFEKFSDKSTVPGINRNHLHTEEVKIPLLPEQKAIASVLSSLDDKIDLLHRQNKTLEEMAEALFRQWFVVEASEEWEVVELSDIAQFKNGKSRPKMEGDYPVYGGNGILGNANEYNAEGETIIIGRVGAYCGSLYFENQKIWVSDNAILGKAKSNPYLYFIFYLLKTMNLNDLAEGSSHPLLTQTLLNKIELQLPSAMKLDIFNTQVEYFFRKTEFNLNQIRTLEKLRDTLLPKLMSGEVRVKK